MKSIQVTPCSILPVNTLLGLVFLHSVSDLLKHSRKLFVRKAIDERYVRDGASTLEFMPGAVLNVALRAPYH